MNIKKFPLFLVLSCVASLVFAQNKPKKPLRSIFIDYHIKLPDSLKNVIKEIVPLYDTKYGLGYDTLHIYKDTLPDDKADQITIAYVNNQNLMLNLSDSRFLTLILFRNTLKHELFHTIKSDTSFLSKKYQFINGSVVFGCQGLAFLIDTLGGKKVDCHCIRSFSLLEEAAAEVFARDLEEDYGVVNESYFFLGNLMDRMINFHWIARGDILKAKRSSSPDLFCSKILKLDSKKHIKIKEINFTVQCFQNIYNNPDVNNLNSILIDILTVRETF